MIRTYHDATILLGGKPLVTSSVTTEDAPSAARTAFDLTKPFSFTTTLGPVDADAMAEFFGAIRIPPTQPAGYVSIPWGILGSIRLNGVVDGAMSGGDWPCPRMEFAMPENEVRRAVSMAVQRAIMCRPQRNGAVSRAILGPDAALHRLSDVVLRKRGERKKRRAMRRLLRAAGILGAA